ncbi:hypothetical protein NQZ68_033866 [Dissostichus eleginoides]|nr:hypothetical protein NQZ68_033866 [Dissostichus eleginoides]
MLWDAASDTPPGETPSGGQEHRTHRQAPPTTDPDCKSPHPTQGAYSNPSPSPDPKFPHPTQSTYPNPIPYPDPKSFYPTQGSHANPVLNPKPLQTSQQPLIEPPLPLYPKPAHPNQGSYPNPISLSLSRLEGHTPSPKTLFLTPPLLCVSPLQAMLVSGRARPVDGSLQTTPKTREGS